MGRFLRIEYKLFTLTLFTYVIVSCQEKSVALNATKEEQVTKSPKKEASAEFKAYWYAGKAEITSYELKQARYGEVREGKAVLIYVTEPFLADKQVKADGKNADNISVLKLNSTKNFLTGIYPYSIMNSSFYPVHDNDHAIKIATSVQEWCGHVYTQLNNKSNKFNITSHSYFGTEADQQFSLEKTILENEIWNKIRINPVNLPIGAVKVIPSLEFIRLQHKKLKAYNAVTSIEKKGVLSYYKIAYPTLRRTLTIAFTTSFPHTIENWTETSISGFGANAKSITSSATKIKTLKSPYWQKNNNSHLPLRDSLGL